MNKLKILSYVIFGFIFFHLAKEMLQVRSDGWYVGQVNLYGDLVFHIGFINKFLESGKILPSSPVFAGTKPEYPILADFVTAQIAKFTSIDFALFITTFLVGLLVIYSARNLIKVFFKSERIVFLSLLLFFFNGGLGFTYFIRDMFSNHQPFLTFLLHLPREYTDLKDLGYWWINNYLAYFLPQRTLLFAFPITLTVLALLYYGALKQKRAYFIVAALLSGALPLIQAHSLFVIFVLSSIYSSADIYLKRFNSKTIINWSLFALITFILAFPLFRAISDHGNVLKLIRFEPGWTSQENIIVFWFKNLGLFGPFLLAALAWTFTKNRCIFYLYLPFLFLFVISNLFIFQPWSFDNSKVLIYWYFASCILVSYFTINQFFTTTFYSKVIGVLFIILMVFSGALDIFRTFTPVTSYQIFTSQDLGVAKSVKELTPKDSVFTTAYVHNHPISALSGRSTVAGFNGWLWSHGLSYEQRVADIDALYKGNNIEGVVRKYKIDYVTVGPLERQNFTISESTFLAFPKIFLSSGWYLYDVSSLWSDSNR